MYKSLTYPLYFKILQIHISLSEAFKMDAQILEFQALFEKLSASKDEAVRKALLNICRSQVGRLETPWETVWRMIMEVST
jgi:hypothetical protein